MRITRNTTEDGRYARTLGDGRVREIAAAPAWEAKGAQTARGSGRGQISSIDLVMATIVMGIMLMYLSSAWTVQSRTVSESQLRDQEQAAALSVSDLLVRSRGNPENWTNNSASVYNIGLASRPNILDANRIANFTNLSYATAKSWMGLDGEEFYVAIVNTSSNATLYSAGFNNNTNVSYNITRFGLLGNTTVAVEVKIYENGQ